MDEPLPWYDSNWLVDYFRAREILAADGERLAHFEAMIDRLRTPEDFRLAHLRDVLSTEELSSLNEAVAGIAEADLEKHEFLRFGRLVVHDHPELSRLSEALRPQVEEVVGEELEGRYSFLSLYTQLGICEPHLDAPLSKWTLDVCLAQSGPWPIAFSQVVPWPDETFVARASDGWPDVVLKDPGLEFTSIALEPGEGVVFSGSSQWHYRNRIERTAANNFCHLLFLHYIPAGMGEWVDPLRWSSLLSAPELARLGERASGANAGPLSWEDVLKR